MSVIKSELSVAGEIFTSALCAGANCNYCYIEKTPHLQELQKNLIKKLQSGEYIGELKKLYGEKLTALAFWGAEPTTTLNYITEKIPELLNTFPTLTEISFSTNMLSDPTIIKNFIMKVMEQNRNIMIKIQCSIDGPPEVTDLNRSQGATAKIKGNFLKLLQQLQSENLKNTKIKFHFKPTWSIENLNWLNEEESRYRYYFFFFDEWIDLAKGINRQKNIYLDLNGVPSMSVPGTYSSEDGKIWAKTCWHLKRLSNEQRQRPFLKHQNASFNTYTYRLIRLFDFSREFFSKPDMFSCSAGRSQNQLGELQDLHLCHRSLFMNHSEYEKELRNEGNWDFHLQQKDRIKLVKEKHIVDINNQLEVDRAFYTWSCFQTFSKHKTATSLALIKELVYSKQISEDFADENLATLFAIFINYGLGCPMENILQTGSLFTSPISLFRLFGASDNNLPCAFQIILEEARSEINK
jgi:sulfatase maturation enzyme AslB (radical SAM superfamily)